MAEPHERLEVDVDPVTSAYLRQRCVRRGDLAGAAAAALHDLAVSEAVAAVVRYHQAHPVELMTSIEDNEAALAELS